MRYPTQVCVQDTVRTIVERIALQEAPELWSVLRPEVRQEVLAAASTESRAFVAELLAALQVHTINFALVGHVSTRHIVMTVVARTIVNRVAS